MAVAQISVLDRLFTPHGPNAYLRYIGLGAPRPVAVPASAPPAPAESGVVVRFARSSVDAEPAGSLLETAEAAGLEPRNRCRRGICGTCTTDLLGGTVRDLRTGEVSDTPGPVRICVHEACDAVTLDL